jgi:undecaprenyl-diphosphatase
LNRLRKLLAAFLIEGFAVALAAAVLFAWLAREVIVGGTRALDFGARDLVQRIASPALTNAMRGFTFLGEWLSVTELAVLSIVLFYRTGRKRSAVLIAITTAGGALLETFLKLIFQRPRPIPFFDTQLPSSYSFPSGHAVLAFCYFGSMAALLTAREPKRGVRIALWAAAAVIATAIGMSRIYLGVHYASDVIAGYAAAVVWIFTVASVYGRWRRRARPREGTVRK